MGKLYIKKKDLGKKIYKIEFSELVKEYFTVVADSKEEAEQKMWDIRSGFKDMDYDTADDHIVYDGYKDYLDDINTTKVDTIEEADFDTEEPDDWIYEGSY